jgi:diguanylate cyclase (GGDEF)-like protein
MRRDGRRPLDAARLAALAALAGAAAIVLAALLGASAGLVAALGAGALATAAALALAGLRTAPRTPAGPAGEPLRDRVTGLPNSMQLRADLAAALARAGETTRVVLSLFVLEGLKKYNDAYGHACGDALLAWLARRARDAAGSRGTVYRMRGGDFALLASGPEHLTGEVRDAVSAALLETGDGFMIWSSAGEATLPREAQQPGDALKLADRRAHVQRNAPPGSAEARPPEDPVEALRHARPRFDVAELATALGRRMGVAADDLPQLEAAAQLRDVGNMAIPSSVLAHPDALGAEEWRFVRLHTLVGERLLAANFGMEEVATLVRSCHERWDGTGYPDGLAGDAIPLGARIVFVCSAFQDMTSERPHRAALDTEAALAELVDGAGTQFDPGVVGAFQAELAASRARVPSPLEPGAWRRMRVLVAEDDAASRFLLRRAVEAAGHECIAAEDGEAAWETYQRALPEVVISDWLMPGIDGDELCRRIRADPDAPYTYFVMLTALEDKEHVLRGMQAGVDDFLTKPLDRPDLDMRLIAAARVTALQRRVRAQQQLIESELELAAGIQRGLLPAAAPELPGAELAGRCVPAANVGGDYFDHLLDAQGRAVLIVADVAGHSISAALLMAMAREVLRRHVADGKAPAELLDATNRALFGDLVATELFITAFCARYDPASGRLEYASAGHNPPFLRRAGGEVLALETEGAALGILEDGDYEQRELRLAPGEALLLYTDGVVEAASPLDVPFGEPRLQALLAGGNGDARGLVEHVLAEVRTHAQGRHQDDVTLLALCTAAATDDERERAKLPSTPVFRNSEDH